jgi:Fusaric acid resistance protein-like
VDTLSRALRRSAGYVWPLLQATAAATVAWVIARYVFNHDQPFFAPIAAVIALNTSLGERGLQALRLLQGVVVGILVGEVALAVLGGTPASLALAVFVAMLIARAMGGARVRLAQAAGSAILVVAIAGPELEVQRLLDALIGAGVALVFTQVLFTPEPVALLRRGEATALTGIGDGLQHVARALERDDEELMDEAILRLRDVRDDLVELSRLRRVTKRVARHSLVWQSRLTPVVRENENAGHLDLLGGSALMLARTLAAAPESERRRFAPAVQGLADALVELAADPGNRATRQRAADGALRLTRPLADSAAAAGSTLSDAILRIVVADVMAFAGVDPDLAVAAVRKGTADLDVPKPPAPVRLPFWSRLRRWRK